MSKSGRKRKLAGTPAYKKGRLSYEDMEYIRINANQIGGDEIAETLNRDPRMVRAWIVENCDKEKPTQPEADDPEGITLALIKAFRKTPEYYHLRAELNAEDLKFFEHRYAKHMTQFAKDEILPTEETQIFQLIKFELLAHRAMEDTKKAQSEIDKLNMPISTLYRECERDITRLPAEKQGLLTNLVIALNGCKSDKHLALKEHNELHGKHAALLKDLKATREQRISKIMSNNMTFTDVIKELQDEEVREREGRAIELMKAAMNTEKSRLSETHTYLDNVHDQPILNHETV